MFSLAFYHPFGTRFLFYLDSERTIQGHGFCIAISIGTLQGTVEFVSFMLPIVETDLAYLINRGLGIVFAEDPAGQVKGPQSIHPGEDWYQLCPIYNALPDSDR